MLAPSIAAFAAALKAWMVYQQIIGNPDWKNQFLSSRKQKELFLRTVMHLLWEDSELEAISAPNLNCDMNHGCIEGVVRRFFNTMVKNLVKELTEIENAKSSQRKSLKLSSMSRSNL